MKTVEEQLLMKVMSGSSSDTVVKSILQDFHVTPRRQERREVEGLVYVRSLGVERKNKVTWMLWVVFQNQRYERYYRCKRDAEEYASRLRVMNDGWLQTHLKHFTKVGGE